MLHVNLLRWHNLIGSLSRDIGQYPMFDISNSGYCLHGCGDRLVALIQTNPAKSVILFIFGVFTSHLRLRE